MVFCRARSMQFHKLSKQPCQTSYGFSVSTHSHWCCLLLFSCNTLVCSSLACSYSVHGHSFWFNCPVTWIDGWIKCTLPFRPISYLYEFIFRGRWPHVFNGATNFSNRPTRNLYLKCVAVHTSACNWISVGGCSGQVTLGLFIMASFKLVLITVMLKMVFAAINTQYKKNVKETHDKVCQAQFCVYLVVASLSWLSRPILQDRISCRFSVTCIWYLQL